MSEGLDQMTSTGHSGLNQPVMPGGFWNNLPTFSSPIPDSINKLYPKFQFTAGNQFTVTGLLKVIPLDILKRGE